MLFPVAEALVAVFVVILCWASTWRPAGASLLGQFLRQEALGRLLLVLAASTLGSLVAGLMYHRALWLTLGRDKVLSPGWYWSPSAYHPKLSLPQRQRVLPWFYAGAACFVGVTLAAGAILWVVLSPS